MTTEFHGADLVTLFHSNPANTGVDHYVVTYQCATGAVVHRVDQADFQSQASDGTRSYQDTLTFAENNGAGLTRTPTVTLQTVLASGAASSGDKEYAQNSIPVLPSAPAITSTYDGVQVKLVTPTDGDLAGYVAWVDTSSTVTIDAAHERYRGAANSFSIPLADDNTYYLRVAPFDDFGLDLSSAWQAIAIKRGADASTLIGVNASMNTLNNSTIPAINTAVGQAQSHIAANKTQAATELASAKSTLQAADASLRGDLTTTQQQATTDRAAAAMASASLKTQADTDRATVAGIRTDLASEVSRAQGAEGTINTTITSLTQTVAGNTSAISSEATQRASADSSLTNLYNAVKSSTDANTSAISSNLTTLTNADTALGSRLDSVTTAYKSADSTIAASVTSEASARSSADGALGTRIDSLTTTVNGNTASISSEQTARTNADSALGSRIDTVTATANGNTSAISTETSARSSADTALGTRIDNLTATVGQNTANISSESTTRASADSSLASQITSLTSAYQNADSSLQANLTSEATTRSSADSSLSTRVDVVKSSYNVLQANVMATAFPKDFSQGYGQWSAGPGNGYTSVGFQDLSTATDWTLSPGNVFVWNQAPNPSTGNGDGYVYFAPKLPTNYVAQGYGFNDGTYLIPVNPGEVWRVSAQTAMTGGGTSVHNVYWNVFSKNGTPIYADSSIPFGKQNNYTVTSDNTWHDIVSETMVPANGAYMRCTFVTNGVNTTGSRQGSGMIRSLRIDNVSSAQTINAQIVNEATARTTADTAITNQVNSLTSTVSTNTSAISTESSTRASADSSLSSRIDSVTATSANNMAAISTEVTTRANADGVLSNRIDSVTATANSNNAAITNEATTRANADTALANRTSSVESRTTSGNYVNTNPDFSSWPASQPYPNGWQNWGGDPATYTNASDPLRGGSTMLRIVVPSGSSNVGIQTLNNFYCYPGWWIAEVRASLDSGSWTGSGVYAPAIAQGGFNFATSADTSGLVSATQTGQRVWSMIFNVSVSNGAAYSQLYAMAQWGNYGAATPKTINYQFVGVRPATDAEIKAQRAFTTDIPNTVARIATEETTRASSDSALSTRIDSVTATANNNASAISTETTARANADSSLASQITTITTNYQNADSALSSTITNNYTSLSNATSSLASRASSLEATTSNLTNSTLPALTSRVSTNEGAIATATGKLSAYWQTTAVAGNNRAQLTIHADANGGGGVDIVGDVAISGNTVIDGTLNATKISAGTITTDRLVDNSVTQWAILHSGTTFTGDSGSGTSTSGTTTATGGAGGSTGGGSCPEITTMVLLANEQRSGPGIYKPAGDLVVGDVLWTQHEQTMAWGAHDVTHARVFDALLYDTRRFYRATASHPFWIDDAWVLMETIGQPSGHGQAVHITVDSAHTFITLDKSGGRVLNHNKSVQAN